MSLFTRVVPLAVVAGLVAACSDVSAPTRAVPVPASSLASKGGGGGGGGNGGGGGSTSPIVTTPATVNATGTWVGTTDGPDVTHTYTFTLTQTAAGTVSGVSSFATPTTTGFALVAGTVNGDTLALYVGAGTVCAGCQLVPYYSGIISSKGTRMEGSFASGGSPLRMFKQ